ncbi:MAG TPA: YifB family Mg chelatase-like AAA ATPase [Polyangiales bacterium]|nr:YifB family Mg chelatase-like AAA ATPase [Polyangiales bacterium]
MIAKVHTGSLAGIDAQGVVVEVSQTRGLPGLDIIGLPGAALRESRPRVLAAISNAGLQLPDRHFVVNLAPADLRKSGASYDLAIALALLCECGICPAEGLEDTLVLGELALDGRIRPARGVLAQLRGARRRGLKRAIIPRDDAPWAALVPDFDVLLAHELGQVLDHFEGKDHMPNARQGAADLEAPQLGEARYGDLSEVYGQASAKRALEIAAAGGHNLVMVGPPGAGKTMLASRLPGILPPLTPEEALELATIASVAARGHPQEDAIIRPFRAPHHSCSDAALIGGGHPIRPGEVTLAHGGVLFLDELPEFRRNVLEALRPTMESGRAVIVRAKERISMPAKPLVVAAMNPCPCGYSGDKKRVCRCSNEQAQRYRARISGPLIDRFDMHVQLASVPITALRQDSQGESSAAIRERVIAARAHARWRRQQLPAAADPTLSTLEPCARQLLCACVERFGLSMRAFNKLLKVSRTVADLESCEPVLSRHVAEAVQYRLFDREVDMQPTQAQLS